METQKKTKRLKYGRKTKSLEKWHLLVDTKNASVGNPVNLVLNTKLVYNFLIVHNSDWDHKNTIV